MGAVGLERETGIRLVEGEMHALEQLLQVVEEFVRLDGCVLRRGHTGQFAVVLREMEQALAAAVDGLQGLLHLAVLLGGRFCRGGLPGERLAQRQDGGEGVHDFVGQHPGERLPRFQLLFFQYVVYVFDREEYPWVVVQSEACGREQEFFRLPVAFHRHYARLRSGPPQPFLRHAPTRADLCRGRPVHPFHLPFAVARDDTGVHVVEQELVIFLPCGLVEQLLPVCGERVFDFPFQAEGVAGFLRGETGNLFQPVVADALYERAQQPDLACLPVVEGSIQADEGRDAHGSGEPQLLRSAETGG